MVPGALVGVCAEALRATEEEGSDQEHEQRVIGILKDRFTATSKKVKQIQKREWPRRKSPVG